MSYWLEALKTAAALATPIIGFLALRNWQRQDKAKRQVAFLDELIEASHAYIAEMQTPLTIWGMIKIGMESHAPAWEQGDKDEIGIKGAIAYIEKNGEQQAKRMFEALGRVRPSTVTLRSLIAKGQVFHFENYSKAQNAITMLVWHFDKIEAFTAVIGSTAMNWEHPEIQRSIKDALSIDPEAIGKNIGENNVALIAFARAIEKKLYG
jgi:hypothetical protein